MEQIKKIISYLGRLRDNLTVLSILALSLAITFTVLLFTDPQHNQQKKEESTQIFATSTPFDSLAVQAKAVYVYDVRKHKVLYEKNANTVLPLASLTKVMTVLTASKLLDANTEIPIDKAFLAIEGDSGLISGEKSKLKDLIDYSLLVSSNDGAEAIAAMAGSLQLENPDATTSVSEFVSEMNALALDIGLTHTTFSNPTGLDIDTRASGGYGSAKDIATLFSYILSNNSELLEATKYHTLTFKSESGFTHIGQNTNEILGKIPNIVASKTGFTDLSGGNLVVIFDAGLDHPIVVAVLGSTYDGRFNDVLKLAEASRKFLNNDPGNVLVTEKGTEVKTNTKIGG